MVLFPPARRTPGACALPRIIDFYHLWNAQHARAHVHRTALLIRTVLYYNNNIHTHTHILRRQRRYIYVIIIIITTCPRTTNNARVLKKKKFGLWKRGDSFVLLFFFRVCAVSISSRHHVKRREFSRVQSHNIIRVHDII